MNQNGGILKDRRASGYQTEIACDNATTQFTNIDVTSGLGADEQAR